MKLMGTHSLLAGAQQMESIEPLVQWNVAVLENRADRNAELFPTRLALPDALASMGFLAYFRLQFRGFADHTAMWTHRTIGPALRFEVFARLVRILEVRL